jgi:hypothetical protein
MKALIGLTIAVLAAGPASAAVFTTLLNGANEAIPNMSAGTGTGMLVLSSNATKIKVDISWSGLTGPLRAGHTHCCALPGANGPVAIDFSPPAAATGSFSRFYDLGLASTYSAGFLASNGGSAATARLAFLGGLNSGRAYFNLHTARFPGGEIRGNLLAGAVPEPASWAMLIAGFGLTGATLRRRRYAALNA